MEEEKQLSVEELREKYRFEQWRREERYRKNHILFVKRCSVTAIFILMLSHAIYYGISVATIVYPLLMSIPLFLCFYVRLNQIITLFVIILPLGIVYFPNFFKILMDIVLISAAAQYFNYRIDQN